jgi:hypothetical protein
MVRVQSSHIQVPAGKELKGTERDIKRAEMLKDFFANVPDLKFE